MRENSSNRPSVDVVFKLMESGMSRTPVVEILIPTSDNVFVDVRFFLNDLDILLAEKVFYFLSSFHIRKIFLKNIILCLVVL